MVVAKVEFGSTGLGESSKVEVKPDNEYAVFDFTSTLSVVASEPLVLDELTQTPVVGMLLKPCLHYTKLKTYWHYGFVAVKMSVLNLKQN